MELPVEIVPARAVRELIARTLLADETVSDQSPSSLAPTFPERLGSVHLHPHQISAVSRIRLALDEFGGALLADEVGMGKTFVALAVATRFRRSIVIGPAVLRDMWSHQERLAGMEIPFLSFESLSRGRRADGPFDLVVIDEAHHVRNMATRRYRELSRMAMHARVLMLSATPVHNRRSDLTALLAIFLGSQAESLSSTEIARCLVRRGVESAGLSASIPCTGALVWKELRDDARVPAALLALPPPLPARGGGVGGVLVARSLLRQWCSSDATLESALRRRLAKSMALISALESGHYPSQKELSAWTVADDSVQLAFPSLVATPRDDAAELLGAIHKHQKALRDVVRSLNPEHPRDRERAAFLKEIRRAHPGIPVVAFSQYAETVNALFRELRAERGIAALTAKGARVAGGSITRREALVRFAPRASGAPPPRDVERIDVLLATDLLSEGVNLQDAGVVVHMDLPWTAARLEQRLGRVVRMGSAHSRVYAYGIRPPAAADILIRLEATITAKMREAEATVGGFHSVLASAPGDKLATEASVDSRSAPQAPTAAAERIRFILRRWYTQNALAAELRLPLASEGTRVAAVGSRQSGFLAMCAQGAKLALVASDGRRVTNEPSEVLGLLLHADGRDVPPQFEAVTGALNLLQSHLRTEHTVALTYPQSAVAAQARRAALRRVSAIVQNGRPHARSRLLELAIVARDAILGRLGVAAEAELMRLVEADLPDEEWLRAIGDQVAGAVEAKHGPDLRHGRASAARVMAILLLEHPQFPQS